MTSVIVRESIIGDVYILADRLRERDRREVIALGVTPRQALRGNFRDAVLRQTYLVDGEIAAMSGLCGAMLSDIGHPYLMTSPAAERAPVSFLRCARAAVKDMLRLRRRLDGVVDASYGQAIRLLEVLGFELSEPRETGPHKALFRTFSLVRHDVRRVA